MVEEDVLLDSVTDSSVAISVRACARVFISHSPFLVVLHFHLSPTLKMCDYGATVT